MTSCGWYPSRSLVFLHFFINYSLPSTGNERRFFRFYIIVLEFCHRIFILFSFYWMQIGWTHAHIIPLCVCVQFKDLYIIIFTFNEYKSNKKNDSKNMHNFSFFLSAFIFCSTVRILKRWNILKVFIGSNENIIN